VGTMAGLVGCGRYHTYRT